MGCSVHNNGGPTSQFRDPSLHDRLYSAYLSIQCVGKQYLKWHSIEVMKIKAKVMAVPVKCCLARYKIVIIAVYLV